jgi:hypothetical protein
MTIRKIAFFIVELALAARAGYSRPAPASYKFLLGLFGASAGFSSVTTSPSLKPPVTITSSSFCLPTSIGLP